MLSLMVLSINVNEMINSKAVIAKMAKPNVFTFLLIKLSQWLLDILPLQ